MASKPGSSLNLPLPNIPGLKPTNRAALFQQSRPSFMAKLALFPGIRIVRRGNLLIANRRDSGIESKAKIIHKVQ